MKDLKYIENRFYEVYCFLTEADILEMEKRDNGPLNNVIAHLQKECFGGAIYEEAKDYMIELFYVNNVNTLQGDLIRLNLDDPDYVPILFYFCQMLVINYKDLDTIDTFNCFQSHVRTFLEKLGFFTTTNLELKKFEGKDVVMMSNYPKGIKKVIMFDKLNYYRKFFGENYKILREKDKDYTYLMVNNGIKLH